MSDHSITLVDRAAGERVSILDIHRSWYLVRGWYGSIMGIGPIGETQMVSDRGLPLRVAVAFDSFRGTISSIDAVSHFLAGAPANTQCTSFPMSDGGGVL
ncbi:MAG: hypothetical protein ACYDHP_00810 [Ferrimicrobium sp.]